MRAWITHRPVITYYVLTLVISWGYWFTLIVQGMHVTPGSDVSHFPGLLGPLLSAFILTSYLDGRAGINDLFSRMLRWRAAWPWGILIALSPLPVAALVFIMLIWIGMPLPTLEDFSLFPGLPGDLSLWVIVLLVFVVNGYGEEVGWRGFVMERWLPRYGRFQTTIRISGLWLFWHAPMFLLNDSMTALIGPVLIGWALGLVCGAFVLAHLYLLGGRSILTLALWHAAYNMMVAPPAGAGIPAAVVSTAVMVWGVVVAWKWWRCAAGSEHEKERNNIL